MNLNRFRCRRCRLLNPIWFAQCSQRCIFLRQKECFPFRSHTFLCYRLQDSRRCPAAAPTERWHSSSRGGPRISAVADIGVAIGSAELLSAEPTAVFDSATTTYRRQTAAASAETELPVVSAPPVIAASASRLVSELASAALVGVVAATDCVAIGAGRCRWCRWWRRRPTSEGFESHEVGVGDATNGHPC